MRQPFIKLISLSVALLGLSTALVVGVGLVLFLSFSGVQLPSLSDSASEIPVEAVEISVVKALVDAGVTRVQVQEQLGISKASSNKRRSISGFKTTRLLPKIRLVRP